VSRTCKTSNHIYHSNLGIFACHKSHDRVLRVPWVRESSVHLRQDMSHVSQHFTQLELQNCTAEAMIHDSSPDVFVTRGISWLWNVLKRNQNSSVWGGTSWLVSSGPRTLQRRTYHILLEWCLSSNIIPCSWIGVSFKIQWLNQIRCQPWILKNSNFEHFQGESHGLEACDNREQGEMPRWGHENASYHVFQIAKRITSHLCLHNAAILGFS